MKLLVSLLLVFSLDAAAQVMRPTSFDGRSSCEKSKGVWRQFGNGCGDECYSKFDQFAVCPETITSACDCGKGSCWNSGEVENSGSCISLSEYQRIFDKQQSEEKVLLEKAKKERLSRYKKQRRKMMDQYVQSAGAAPAAPSADGKANVASNNLSTFYNKPASNVQQQAASGQVGQVQMPQVKNSPPQAILQPVPPLLDQQQGSGDDFLSMFPDDKNAPSATIVPVIPQAFLDQEKAKQDAAAQAAAAQNTAAAQTSDTSSQTANSQTANTTTTSATQQQGSASGDKAKEAARPTIGVSPSSQNPHDKLKQSKSLFGADSSSDGLPQLPMP